MAKRNRRRKAHFKPANIGLAALFVVSIVPWAIYSLLSLANNQVATQIKLLEQEKRSQEESLRRYTAEWNQLIEPRRLDEAIARNGLKMSYAPPERTARIREDGVVIMSRQLREQMLASNTPRAEERTVASSRTRSRRTTRR